MLTKSALPNSTLVSLSLYSYHPGRKKMQKKYFRDVKIRNNEKVFL